MKKKETKSSMGSFGGMGLSRSVQRGIGKAGYRDATPIQRKAIPLLLEGRDVVAMARTGSGKSAAFIIPLLERLAKPRLNIGIGTARGPTSIRAIIFAPTRELALQTKKFVKLLGHYSQLKVITTLGGDSMEDQFAALHEGPDVVVATPGRFLHLCVEMSLKLFNVEYVVFDEADRLFELGLGEQLSEIIARLPDSRQTAMFSATMPQLLADFANAGLNNPTLIRLDVESSLSERLSTHYLAVRSQDKYAALLYLLKHVIAEDSMTAVFLPTRHHVEYVKELLERVPISSAYVYSALDAEARKENIRTFQKKQARVLLVTDVAARGIDIPLLDVVINFNFPHKAKLFVHRVGRVARAQREGTAFSLVSAEELAYLHDLHIFLGKSISYSGSGAKDEKIVDGSYGAFPQDLIDEQNELIERWKSVDSDLQCQFGVTINAIKQYIRSIGAPPAESVRAMKAIRKLNLAPHEILSRSADSNAAVASPSADFLARDNMLSAIRNYKPTSTIFEIGEMKHAKHAAYSVMRHKRNTHDKVLVRKEKELEAAKSSSSPSNKSSVKDEHFLPYEAPDRHREKGLGLEKNGNALTSAVMDMASDEVQNMRQKASQVKWDRKKKRFINLADNGKKIRTESGAKIPASYKSDVYKRWKAGYQIDEQDDMTMDGNEEDAAGQKYPHHQRLPGRKMAKSRKRDGELNGKKRGPAPETWAGLRPKEEILRDRLRKEQRQKHEKWRQSENAVKRQKKPASDAPPSKRKR